MSKILSVVIIAILIVVGFFALRHLMNSPIPTPTQEKPQIQAFAKNVVKEKKNELMWKSDYFNSWVKYAPSSGKFQVKFPAFPLVTSKTVFDANANENVKYDTYVAQDKDGSIFMISEITYSKSIPKDQFEDISKQLISDMIVRNKNNKIEYLDVDRTKNGVAVYFSLTHQDLEELSIAGKVLGDNDTIYILSMADKNQDFDRWALDYFIDSFNFKHTGVNKQ